MIQITVYLVSSVWIVSLKYDQTVNTVSLNTFFTHERKQKVKCNFSFSNLAHTLNNSSSNVIQINISCLVDSICVNIVDEKPHRTFLRYKHLRALLTDFKGNIYT